MAWSLQTMVPERLLLKQTYDLQMNIRKRALAKQERESKKQ
jgi:hypothetical protein